jgi:RimJ/RimL family protein N-acetyltransferase
MATHRRHEIETARLRLRPFVRADLGPLHALWTDEHVRRFLWDDEIIPVERALDVVRASAAGFAESGLGFFTVRLADENDLAGFVGFRPVDETREAEVEILYGLAVRAWGRGFATEAARAALRDAFESSPLRRIVARADAPNRASIRVMERLGMRFEWLRREGDGDIVCWSIARETALRDPR